MAEVKYYGEAQCMVVPASGKPCTNKTYFQLPDGRLVCGVHNKGKVGVPLPRNPNAAKMAHSAAATCAEAIVAAQKANTSKEFRGTVKLAKLQMMRTASVEPGYLAVYPNHRAGSAETTTRINARELSPMVIGPIEHGQPGLPPAKCLENFFQSNKAFKSEVDKNNNPLPVWYERRLALYNDPAPHRHKLGASKAEHLKNAGLKQGENANVALYSIFVGPDGKEQHLSYVESRRYYCHFYEIGALKTPIFKRLFELLATGTNLQIFDPDGHPMSSDMPQEKLAEVVRQAYEDGSQPFGHGVVLFTMLALPRQHWPWVKFFESP